MEYDLVFEGGGAKGMAFVGAMRAFNEAGHTYRRIVGSSAGAITATTLAAGYTTAEMQAALRERVEDKPVFTTFLGLPQVAPEADEESPFATYLRSLDIPGLPGKLEDPFIDGLLRALAARPRGRHLLSFIDSGGWYSAAAFVDWLEGKLNEGTFRGRPRRFGGHTFAQFFEATGYDLSLTASDTTNKRLLVLNHRTAPDLPVVWGARMSMSLPLVWEEVVWREAWGLYRGRSPVGHTIVDGGLLSNFPIELLVSAAPEVTGVMGERTAAPVIGFLIDETLPVPGAPAAAESSTPAAFDGFPPFQRLRALVDTVTQARDKGVIATNERRVVRLPARGYGTTEFDMDDARRAALVAAAEAAAAGFLAREGDGLETLGEDSAEVDRIARGLLDMSDW